MPRGSLGSPRSCMLTTSPHVHEYTDPNSPARSTLSLSLPLPSPALSSRHHAATMLLLELHHRRALSHSRLDKAAAGSIVASSLVLRRFANRAAAPRHAAAARAALQPWLPVEASWPCHRWPARAKLVPAVGASYSGALPPLPPATLAA